VWPAPDPASRREYLWRGELFRTPLGIKDEIAYLGPERQDRYERYDQDFTALAIVATGLHRSDIPLAPITPREHRASLALLERLHITSLADRRLLTLSYGQRRLVLLARALASRPALLLLDEAGSGLDARNRGRLDSWLRASARSLMPWVYTTHRATDVPAAANRLLLLEEGRILHAGAFDRALVRKRLTRPHARTIAKPARGETRTRRSAVPLIALEAADVYAEAVPLLRSIDLQVRPGDCWVVHGANGSGKSTLLRALYGDHAIARPGRVRRSGSLRMPLERFRARTGLVAPHLHAQHLPQERALDVAVSGLHSSIGLSQAPTPGEVRRARRALRELDLDALRGRSVKELSYGQMRRLLFARAFVSRPRLLLLDEPFSGVDAQTRNSLLAVIEAHVSRGMAVVMASHHREEWPRCATHELQLRRGRAVYCGPVRRP
jgi:molybdate transport system ATP-binding protein